MEATCLLNSTSSVVPTTIPRPLSITDLGTDNLERIFLFVLEGCKQAVIPVPLVCTAWQELFDCVLQRFAPHLRGEIGKHNSAFHQSSWDATSCAAPPFACYCQCLSCLHGRKRRFESHARDLFWFRQAKRGRLSAPPNFE